MSLNNAIIAGISGLQAQSKVMSNIANNINNDQVDGYKSVQIYFNNQINKSGNNQVNYLQTKTILNLTEQGNFQATQSPTDIAISGKGFFVVGQNNKNDFLLTRNGSFYLNQNNLLINKNNLILKGWRVQEAESKTDKDRIAFTQNEKNYMAINNNNQVIDIKKVNSDIADLQYVKILPDDEYIKPKATEIAQIAFAMPKINNINMLDKKYFSQIVMYNNTGKQYNVNLSWQAKDKMGWNLDLSLPENSNFLTLGLNNKIFKAKGILQLEDAQFTPNSKIALNINDTAHLINFANKESSLQTKNSKIFTLQKNQSISGSKINIGNIEFKLVNKIAANEQEINIDNANYDQILDRIINSVNNYFNTRYGPAPWLKKQNNKIISNLNLTNETGAIKLLPSSNNKLNVSIININQTKNKIVEEIANHINILITQNNLQNNIKVNDNAAKRVKNSIIINQHSNVNPININVDIENTKNNFTIPRLTQISNNSTITFNPDGHVGKVFGTKVTDMAKIEIGIAWNSQDNKNNNKIDMVLDNKSGIKTKQIGNIFNIINQNIDGNNFQKLQNLKIDENGIINAIYPNTQKPIYQIALTYTNNIHGVIPVSGTAYKISKQSGLPMLSSPNNNYFGKIKSYNIEQSAVDISTEMYKMITVQKAYSAAAKIISTSDKMLKETSALLR